MYKLFCSFLFFYCALAAPVHAESMALSDNGFVIARARKLGRSDPFSFNENTSASNSNSSKYRFECHDKNCQTCNYATGICSTCHTGYFLSNRLCKSCSSIKIDNGICTLCTSSTSCQAITCNSGYIKKDNACKTCSQLYDNCLECNDSKCTKCENNKLLKGGKCVKCPDNAICDGTSKIKCKPSFIQAKSQYKCLHCPAGCSECTYLDTLPYSYRVNCTKCESRFRLDTKGGRSYCEPDVCGKGFVYDTDHFEGYFTLREDDTVNDTIYLSVCRIGSGYTVGEGKRCYGGTRCNEVLDLYAYEY